ncbi:MAG: tetraacyldisaccharide 4'-kinase, partial [Parachlamydiaceae bacterium]
RSQAERSSLPLVLSKDNGEMHPASLCGDEPVLLAQNLPKVHVIVGKDRYLSSKIAARLGVQVILLDDGMQHRGIARDLEVVVMDLLDPFGQGYFLPRGLLREGKKALSRADLIILNHLENVEQFEGVKRQISSATSAPVVGTKLEVLGAFHLDDQPVESVKGTKVGIFCGIAHPEYFRNTIDKLGFEVVDEWFFPDHDAIDLEKLIPFSKRCQEKGAELLLCTEKDRVKLTEVESCLPIGWIKARLSIVEGQEYWNQFILRAKNKIKSKIRESQ